MPGKVLIRALIALAILIHITPGDITTRAQAEPQGRLNVELNVRSGPGITYPVVGVLPGTTVVILEARDDEGGWLLIHTPDETMRGWVARGYVYIDEWVRVMDLPLSQEQVSQEQVAVDAVPVPDAAPVPADALGTAYATVYLNVRSGPSVNDEYLTTVAQGTILALEGRDAAGAWALVHTEDGGARGWVAAGFLQIEGIASLNALPVVEEQVTPGAPAPVDVPAADAPSLAYTTTYLNVRSGPGITHNYLTTAPVGAALVLEGRDAAAAWALVHSEDGGIRGWVAADFLRVAGDAPLEALPVVEQVEEIVALPPASPSGELLDVLGTDLSTVTGGPTNPIVPAISAHAREIYLHGQQLGNNPRAFIRIGDCNSEHPYFLSPFGGGYDYDLGEYAYLQNTINHFYGSFWRADPTVATGYNAMSILDPTWANLEVCMAGESPLACAYRLYRPSVAFVSLGTNGYEFNTFRDDMRAIVENLLERGVIPVLATKADNREGDGWVNAFIVELAAEYDVPLWNFWLAVQGLPNNGMRPDGWHLVWANPDYTKIETFQAGFAVRNLTALQVLDAVWRGAMY